MTDKTHEEIAGSVIQITRQFLAELGKERTKNAVTLTADFSKDLGIDSLGKVELFHRIEEAFQIRLSESLMVEAQNLIEIVPAIEASEKFVVREGHFQPIILEETTYDPSLAESLVEVLLNRAAKDPNRTHIILQDENGDEKIITYSNLLKGAQRVASGLQERNINPYETVAIMLPTSEDFFYVFFGILLVGAVPVPIYPPFRPDKIEEYALRASGILKNAQARILITFDKTERLSDLLKIFVTSLEEVTTVVNLVSDHKIKSVAINANMPALIQYTSGSTSAPKGVLLTHHNLLSNMRSSGEAIQFSASDVGVSWLPLYHDMGLIGSWLTSFYYAAPVVIFSPLTFISRPERWLWAIHYHRATLTAAPNFAYELCVRRITDEQIKGLDLSSLRISLNGAEPINPETLQSFIKKFAPYGLKSTAMFPSYGLAESCVALSFPGLNEEPKIDIIDRDLFEKEQRAVPAKPGQDRVLQFVGCGQPIPNHDIKMVDGTGKTLSDRNVGYLYFRGPSTMQGYYQNPQATQAIFHDGWWDSGDLGYISEGTIYIAGRKKDLIIKAGRNLYPAEIEQIAAEVTGIRKGCVVAFGVNDEILGTEKLVIVAETSETSPENKKKIEQEVIEKISVVLAVVPDEVVLVPPKTVPKTSSGKLQRAACKQDYLDHKLFKKHWPPFIQIAKLLLKGASVKIAKFLQLIGFTIYNIYIWILLLVQLPLFFILILTLSSRYLSAFLHYWSKIMIALVGCRMQINNKAIIESSGPCIYVANHASYIDAVILLAVLPIGIQFVGKKELFKVPLLSAVLRKINTLPVDRADFASSIENAQAVETALQKGNSIAIFPEGMFSYANGLRAFKLGAFKVAMETGMPICPITITGARKILRGNEFIFRPGTIQVTVGEKILPQSHEWSEVIRLHTLARQEIALHCGEPSIDY